MLLFSSSVRENARWLEKCLFVCIIPCGRTKYTTDIVENLNQIQLPGLN